MHWIWTAASLGTAGMLYTRVRWQRSQVYLTFDDGPDPAHTLRLLQVLKQHQVRATFFVIGSKAEQHGDIMQQIVEAGHSLGNHSYSHPQFDAIPVRLQAEELARTEQVLAGFDGRRRHAVRPPYGKATLGTILLCLLRGQRIALWNRDSLDYRLDHEAVVRRMSAMPVKPGDVLLFHDDDHACIEALQVLLPRWREAGLRFGTL